MAKDYKGGRTRTRDLDPDNDMGSVASSTATGAAGGASLGPWGAAIGAGVGLLKGAYGISQQNKAKQLAAQNQRPSYQIPQEIQQNLNDAQRMSLEGLPDEQKQQFVNNIQRSQEFGLQGMSDRKSGIAGLGTLVQTGNDQYNNLLGQDAAARQRNQQQLFNARSAVAGYRNQAFDINQMQPYQDRAAAARGLQGAGTQNMFGGLNDVAQAGMRFKGFNGNGNDNQGLGGGAMVNPTTSQTVNYQIGNTGQPITTPGLQGLGTQMGGGYQSQTPNWM